AGLLGELTNHRVERVLGVLDPAAGEGPVPGGRVVDEQHATVVDAHGVGRQSEAHPGQRSSRLPDGPGSPAAAGIVGRRLAAAERRPTMPDLAPEIVERLRRFPRVASSADGTRAAVAIVLLDDPDQGICFLLTRRTPTLSAHAGQFALPGGRLDD